MKSNRILVVLFTLMVIASLLAGCGGAAEPFCNRTLEKRRSFDARFARRHGL